MSTDGSPTDVSILDKRSGFACTICGVAFDDADARLDHWVAEHGDNLPDGFADRVGPD